jgi:type IV pilus assembly protein PilQ
MRYWLIFFLSGMGWANHQDGWTFQLEYMPLRYLLQTLADINHQNIALSQNISGKMDIHLKQVRWQDLWQFLMTTQHLQVQETQGIIWVDKAYQVFPIDKEHPGIPQIVHKHLVLSHVEVKRLRELLENKNNGLLSPLGKVLIDERTNSVWLSDMPEYLSQSLKFIQKMDVLSAQIEIEARIVSINRNCAKDLGIRLGFTQPGLMSGQLAGLHEPSADKNLNINLPALPLELNPITYAIALAKLGQQYIDAELSALEGQGKADIIARPRLVAENQQEASISTGEDIPYQEITHSGATSVAFKKALLLLKVRPYILAGQKVLLNLEINQDADSGHRVQGVPVISTKSMNTKVLIQSGETLVLGGIHKNDVHYEKVGLPVLKDIPLLGQLFARQQQRLEREELLIFITPKIIGL